MAQIDRLRHKITVKFLTLQADLIKSLKSGHVTPAQLVQTLKHYTHGLTSTGLSERSSASLFQEHEEELTAAKEIEDIFLAINPYFSYFNYELIEVIVNVHGAREDKENMQRYHNDFSEYCRKMPCVEFQEECSSDKSKHTKIKFKLDYNANQLKLGDIKCIQRRIAEILNLKSSVLYLYRVEDGCMVITFLVPTFWVESLMKIIANNISALQKNVKLLYVEPHNSYIKVCRYYNGKFHWCKITYSCHPGLQKKICVSKFCTSAPVRPHLPSAH